MSVRKIRKITKGFPAVDGAGVHLVRVFGNRDVYDYDPFLLLDAFDSSNSEDYIKGFPWHPHRGIETITYLIEGKLEHGDSLGNSGIIQNGECQWMTAGSGIIHQEMPQPSNRMLGAQIWLNLPKKDKMTTPKYGDIKQGDVPKVEEDGTIVSIVAGSYKDISGAFKAEYVNATYLDVSLKEGKEFALSIPEQDTLFIYLIEGKIETDNQEIDMRTAVLYSIGDKLVIKSLDDKTRFLLLYATPLREPIEWGGPIVMNSREELRLAFKELNDGTFIK